MKIFDAFYEKLINEKLEERKIRIQKSIKKDKPDLLGTGMEKTTKKVNILEV